MGAVNSGRRRVVTLILNGDHGKTTTSKIRVERKPTWSEFRRTVDVVFPELTGKSITVVWHSSDNKTCKVSSDEELVVAVQSMGDRAEFHIKRTKISEDHADKIKDKPSLRNDPRVSNIMKPFSKIFSQKDIKQETNQTNKVSVKK